MTASPSPALTIRPATKADVPDIAAIYAQHVVAGFGSFEEIPPSVDEMLRRFAALEAGGFPYLVATAGAAIAGYAYAGPYHHRSAYRFAVEDSVYVHPDMGGRGVGRALLTRLVAEAEARGFRQMIAVIGDSANTASIRLHAALGFEMAGTVRSVGFKRDRWLDIVIMQRTLGVGDSAPPAARG
ncbi:MAG: N-acetyltransferase family protein [Alphaproteobacteria bacterium]|nr:N-acetyltransferase family protein [Alphaproteobacteria bacterium]MDX5369648.1 N-acetyltransferase family protein [Alphaproteobacteria bacterium]MDX5464283.1 N-acetyltransferase family protein [Alphaproteobacteria bacterium]